MVFPRPHLRSITLAIVATAAALGLGLSGCSSSGSAASGTVSGETRAVETHYGDIDVPVAPKRVVAVSYDTPWQLRSIGVKPVGVQDYSAYVGQFTPDATASVKGIPTIGAFFSLDLESVAAAKPDLIVGDALEIDDELYKKLSAIAPTTIFSADYRGDWRTIGTGVADAVNKSAAFDTLAGQYDERAKEITTTYSSVLTGKRWAGVSEGESADGFSILYPTGVLGALWFKDLGATLAPGVPESNANGFEFISGELTTTVLGEADVIVAPADADGSLNPTITAVKDAPLFSQLPAVTADNMYWVYSTVTDYASALEWLDRVEADVLKPLSAKG
ncbi:ABC transporter substrate-binding protein [Plantibacter sp. YIM 135347]|uniref:ABC transporter substrate-binding protein n=1 Tax=Plantibacter sp. YIM 135347 TaxID=3423919 RepID=UPI003D33FF39